MTINEDKEKKNVNFGYNVNEIKKEYNFYKELFEQYLAIKKMFLISEENERKIFGNLFAILLLSEYEYFNDSLIQNIINNNYRELKYNDKSLTNLFNQLRNILLSDIRFNHLSSSKNQLDRKRNQNLLSKISYCLNIPEDKIFYILLTETNYNKDSNKDKNDNCYRENIITNELSLFNNIIDFIKILFLKSIDNILEIFSLYNQRKKLTFSNQKNKPKKKINILFLRSNLIYNITNEKYLSNNSFLAVSDIYI